MASCSTSRAARCRSRSGNVVAPQEVVTQERRRHPAPLGRRLGLFRGSAHRPGDPEVPGRRLSPPAQHAALSAGRARRLQRDASVSRRRRCRSSSAGSCIASPSSMRWCARRSDGLRFPHHVHGAAQFLRRRSLGLLFRCPQGLRSIATRRMRRAAARRAPCSIMCSSCLVALAGAGALLHRRRSVAQPSWRRRGVERPSPALSAKFRDAGATTALATKWARIRELRRVVTGAIELERAAEAHRLQPAGRRSRFSRRPIGPRRWQGSICPSSALPPLRRSGLARCRRMSSRSAMCRASGCGSCRRRARNASAAGACCPRSARMRRIPISAIAAPIPSRPWPAPNRRQDS